MIGRRRHRETAVLVVSARRADACRWGPPPRVISVENPGGRRISNITVIRSTAAIAAANIAADRHSSGPATVAYGCS